MKKMRGDHDDADDDLASGGARGADGGEMMDAKTSKKILELSRAQQREMEEEAVRGKLQRQHGSGRQQQQQQGVDSSDEEESDNEEYDDDEDLIQRDDKGYVTMSDNIGLTPEEEALLSTMMGGGNSGEGGMNDDGEEPERKTLADIIMAKIEEKEAMAMAGGEGEVGGEEEMGMELPPKVVQVRAISVYGAL